MERIEIFSSRAICCAQDENQSDVYKARFVISDFSENRNAVEINRDTIGEWMGSLVGKPLVGKLVSTARNGTDFSGHNMRVVYKKDSEGNLYSDAEFDTSAFGTFTDVSIEKIDNVECIVASCNIWKRFVNACSIIMERVENGTLNTSWEISVLKSHKKMRGGNQVKVIDNGIFTAHCLLGASVTPAYDCSRLLEVAEAQEKSDEELANAILKDIDELQNSNEKEVAEMILENNVDVETNEIASTAAEESPVVEETVEQVEANVDTDVAESKCENCENPGKCERGLTVNEGEVKDIVESVVESAEAAEVEKASLTAHDIMRMLHEAVSARNPDYYIHCWFPAENTIWVQGICQKNELDVIVYTYEVVNETVVLSEPVPATMTVTVKNFETVISDLNGKIADMSASIAEAASKISEKDNEIAELNKYRDRCEKEDKEKADAEMAERKEALKNYAVSSKLISVAEVSEGGELFALIESEDKAGINSVIAERFMSKNAEDASKVEVSEAHTKVEKVDLRNVCLEVDYKSLMSKFLNG